MLTFGITFMVFFFFTVINSMQQHKFRKISTGLMHTELSLNLSVSRRLKKKLFLRLLRMVQKSSIKKPHKGLGVCVHRSVCQTHHSADCSLQKLIFTANTRPAVPV